MNKTIAQSMIAMIVLAGAVFFATDSAYAARVEMMKDVPEWNDFDLGPTSFPIAIEPGQSVTKTLQLTNRTGKRTKFFVEVEDFEGTADPTQTVALQGENKGKYSAKDWTAPELMEFEIEHGERQFFDVTINVPLDADGGDRYVAVLVRTKPSEEMQMEGQAIRLVSRVGSLFFVKVPGNIKEEGELVSFAPERKVFWQAPTRMSMLFKNTGTVRLTPSGSIVVKDWLGRVVDTLEVKEYNVLRDSVRAMTNEWTPPRWKIGFYTAELTLNRGYGDNIDSKSLSFWYLPKKELLILLGAAVGIVILLIIIRKKVSISVGLKK